MFSCKALVILVPNIFVCERVKSHLQVNIHKSAWVHIHSFKICSTGFLLKNHITLIKKKNEDIRFHIYSNTNRYLKKVLHVHLQISFHKYRSEEANVCKYLSN